MQGMQTNNSDDGSPRRWLAIATLFTLAVTVAVVGLHLRERRLADQPAQVLVR